MPRSFGETQWDWLEAQLKASTADYLIVGGHYPVSAMLCTMLLALMLLVTRCTLRVSTATPTL